MATSSATLKTRARASSVAVPTQSSLTNLGFFKTLAEALQVIRSRAILIVLVVALTYLLSSVFTITILSSAVSLSTANEGVKAAVSEAQNTERSLQVRFSAVSSLDEIRRYALSSNMGMIEAHAYQQLPVAGLKIIVNEE